MEFGAIPEALRVVGERTASLRVFEVDVSAVKARSTWRERNADGSLISYSARRGKAKGGSKTKKGEKAVKDPWLAPTTVYLLCAPGEEEQYSAWILALASDGHDCPRIKMGCNLRYWLNGDAREGDVPFPPSVWLDLTNYVAFSVRRDLLESLPAAG